MASDLLTDMVALQSQSTFCDEAINLEDVDPSRAKFPHSFKKKHHYAIATPPIFQNPFMTPNNFSEIHNNAYQTDTFSISGPGRAKHTSVQEKLVFPPAGIGATLAFNSRGQIITIRTSIDENQQMANTLLLIDPESLEIIARTDLPSRVRSSSQITFSGAYFYLDNQDRAVCVSGNQEIQIYAVQNNQFVLINVFDLSNIIGNSNDLLNSVLPDSNGNFWFITEQALIGYGTPNGIFQVVSIRDFPGANPNETNSKSFATDEDGGVYALTDYALYRYQVVLNDIIEGILRASYDRGTRIKPGQNQQGSGTTPTIFNDFEGNKFSTSLKNYSTTVWPFCFS